jgi:leucine dehydrogenase
VVAFRDIVLERRHPLGVFETIGTDTHEEVLFGSDRRSGLRTIIAIHNTSLGPALGGTRFYPYRSEEEALDDVLRLSKGMTYKSAAAGLDLGGGKAVIIGDPETLKSERLLRAYARIIDDLGGRYITAEDVGTTMEDMVTIGRETQWVTGLPYVHGGSGDPSPATARGVIAAMRATAARLWGSDDLAGKRVAIQGVGKVGMSLVERLTAAGAETIITDVNLSAVDHAATTHGCKAVEIDDIYSAEVDIFAPCALGASLNHTTIPRLRCAAVVGSANNQLAEDGDADHLATREILYAPDFVANAGGVINITVEMEGYSTERAAAMVDRIYDNVTAVFATADRDDVNPHVAATRVGAQRIEEVGDLRLSRSAVAPITRGGK